MEMIINEEKNKEIIQERDDKNKNQNIQEKNKENVTKINDYEVYNLHNQFLNRKNNQSNHTATNYKSHIKDFFHTILNKDVEFLTIDDIRLNDDDFSKFIELKKNKISNSSISAKIDAVKSFLRFSKAKLKQQGIELDTGYFDLIEKLKVNGERYDALTTEEVYKLAELAQEERNGEMKRLLIIFAYDTFLRKSEILSVKWADFKHYDDQSDKIKLRAIGKGNKPITLDISKDFYDELNKTLNKGQEFVFNVNIKTIDRMFGKLRSKMDFGNRRIVFHSIRKAGATFFYKYTNDILSTSRRLNHSDVRVTEKYLDLIDYGASGGYSSNNKNELESLDNLTKEELLEVIRKSDKATQGVIIKNAKKLSN